MFMNIVLFINILQKSSGFNLRDILGGKLDYCIVFFFFFFLQYFGFLQLRYVLWYQLLF
jgi:hypothetical protein